MPPGAVFFFHIQIAVQKVFFGLSMLRYQEFLIILASNAVVYTIRKNARWGLPQTQDRCHRASAVIHPTGCLQHFPGIKFFFAAMLRMEPFHCSGVLYYITSGSDDARRSIFGFSILLPLDNDINFVYDICIIVIKKDGGYNE